MSDILEQINSLTEQFSNLFEADKDDLKPYQNKAAKEVMDKLGLSIKGYVKRISPKRDYNELQQHKYRKVKEFATDQLTPYEKVKGITLEDKIKNSPKTKKKDEIEAHRKEIYDLMKKYKTGDDSVAKSIIKGKKKMNDNNSYNEVVSQINRLTEQLSNLFEVEGLGDPASDVPPSTNKIKKDRKTKDGKVELVSVEDELFPYDGNKREQYRQKIIDTINAMIQGTATLEDLLQIVRQKKMPVKEGFEGAIEILENLYTSAARMKVNANSKGDFKKYELANKAISTLNIKGDPQDKYLEDVEKRQGKKEANAQEDRALGDDTKFKKGFYKTRDKQEHVVNTGSPFVRNYGYSDNAVEKSIERNKKKEQKKALVKEGFEGAIEILENLEEIINEVSVGALARAAENSFPSRKKEDDDLEQKRQEIHKEGSKTKSKKKIEKLYNELQDTLGKSIKANRRYNQAKNIVDLNLPKNSKVSVSKLVDSAKKSQVGRGLAHNAGSEVPYEKYKRTLKRVHRANDIADIKPNKLEVDEALKESIQQLSELFDRPDLLDDISKTLTNKTIKQHLENQVKKLLGGKKKKKDIKENFDSFEENNYNIVKLLEELINEVSDGKHRRKLEELKDGIKKAEEFKEATKDDVVKEKIDDIIIPQEHRLEVSQNKYEDRVVKRAQEEYDKNKAKKEKGK